MAVIENRSTEIGDILIIKADVPIIGLIALLSFTDNVDNSNSQRFFFKQFRFSLDGVNFSDFLELTQENVSSIEVDVTDTFIVEYLYERSGDDDTDDLIFNSVTLNGEFGDLNCGITYQDSLIFDFLGNCNNICTLIWSINVLEKLYKPGNVAKALTRGSNSSNLEDRDFIDFWRSVTHFFAYYVCLARKFATFYSDRDLLFEYLTQRNLFLCEGQDLEDLVYIMQNYLDEIRQRGTIQIALKKTTLDDIDEDQSSSLSSNTLNPKVKPVNGELLRLICYQPCDDFLFNVNKKEHLGWNIGNSSPLFRGQYIQMNLNKSYEDTFVNINKYPKINEQFMSISSQILTIQGQESLNIGIGGSSNFDKAINVDTNVDYEITFLVKKPQNGGNFQFGVNAFDCDGNIINLKNFETQNLSNSFFSISELNRDDKFYFVRGIIYCKNKVYSDIYESKISLGYGQHLQFQEGVKKIIPNITLSNSLDNPGEGANVVLKIPYNELTNGSSGLIQISDTLNGIIFNEAVSYSNVSEFIDSFNANNTPNFVATFEDDGSSYLVTITTPSEVWEDYSQISTLTFISYKVSFYEQNALFSGGSNPNSEHGVLEIKSLNIKPVSTPFSNGFVQTNNFIHIWLKKNNNTLSLSLIHI